jgi:hypothetical protein
MQTYRHNLRLSRPHRTGGAGRSQRTGAWCRQTASLNTRQRPSLRPARKTSCGFGLNEDWPMFEFGASGPIQGDRVTVLDYHAEAASPLHIRRFKTNSKVASVASGTRFSCFRSARHAPRGRTEFRRAHSKGADHLCPRPAFRCRNCRGEHC